MGLYCMETLGRRYQESDETYVLFERVLIDYLPFANDSKQLPVNEEHKNYFVALDNLYKTSKAEVADEWQDEEKMADSLAWYKSAGIITYKNGNYYINSDELKRKSVEYEEHKAKLNAAYKKRPKR